MDDMRTNVPSLGVLGYEAYNEARNTVARMVQRGILEISGEMPLEAGRPPLRAHRNRATCAGRRPAAIKSSSGNTTPHRTLHNLRSGLCEPPLEIGVPLRQIHARLLGGYAEKIRRTAIDPVANQALYDPPLNYLEEVRREWRLLDVGCATGEFLAAAQARDWHVYGVEPSPIGAALAERVPGAVIHTGTLDTAPWPDAYFDAAALFEVIEHLQSPRAYIEKIARLVRPGGMLVLTTPNIRSLAYFLLGRKWDVVGPNDHIYYFAPRTLDAPPQQLRLHPTHIHSLATDISTWRRWLRFRPLQPLAPRLRAISPPLTDRFLLGDAIFLVARRTESP